MYAGIDKTEGQIQCLKEDKSQIIPQQAKEKSRKSLQCNERVQDDLDPYSICHCLILELLKQFVNKTC